MDFIFDLSAISLAGLLPPGSAGKVDPMTLLALGIASVAAVMGFMCLSRLKNSRFGPDKFLQEKVEELTLRLDDMRSRNSNMMAGLAKEFGLIQEKIRDVDEVIASRPAEMRPLEFLMDGELSLEERVYILEEKMLTYANRLIDNSSEAAVLTLDEPVDVDLSLSAQAELEEDDENFEFCLASALKPSRNRFKKAFDKLFDEKEEVGDQFYSQLGKLLVSCNLGPRIAEKVCSELLEEGPKLDSLGVEDVRAYLRDGLLQVLSTKAPQKFLSKKTGDQPRVIVVVGADQKTKASTVGGIALRFQEQGTRVLVGACDVSQNKATENLIAWCEEAKLPVVAGFEGERPRKIAYKSVHKAQDEGYDLLIIDAASRITSETEQREELNEVLRMVEREQPDAHHEVLLVVNSAKGRQAFTSVRSLVKDISFDGLCAVNVHQSEKSGVVAAFIGELSLPVFFIKAEDEEDTLLVFSGDEYVDSLIGQRSEEELISINQESGVSSEA